MHVAEAGIVVCKLEAHVCRPRLDFLAPVKAGTWSDQVVVKEVSRAAQRLVAVRFDQMREKIDRENRGKDEHPAEREPLEPADDAAWIGIDVIVVSTAIVDAEIKGA